MSVLLLVYTYMYTLDAPTYMYKPLCQAYIFWADPQSFRCLPIISSIIEVLCSIYKFKKMKNLSMAQYRYEIFIYVNLCPTIPVAIQIKLFAVLSKLSV